MIYNKRIPISGTDWEFLDVNVYYSLGGYVAFTNKGRGYYLSVTPASSLESGFVMSSPMEGYSKLILPVSRQSKKSEAAAVEKVDEFLPPMIEAVCSKIGALVDWNRIEGA